MASRPTGPRINESACATYARSGMPPLCFMRLDFKYGGGHSHQALRHYFRHEVLPLLNASYSEKVGTALNGAAAEVSQLLEWTAYDVGSSVLA
ncbi:hypothetical protein [Streptomyces sp. NPDC001851]|uniref:hypothetical protein n=1 Tax=Streptomyces sp. NPDC001851 TaxID=3154529 RepID=UPI00333292ED